MNKSLFRAYVSSTYSDLIEYRRAAEIALNDIGIEFLGMEYVGAINEEPILACLDLIQNCDLFIGIYAWRYGFIPEGSDISIIEQEYRYAQKHGIPCLCYIIDEDYPWSPKFIEHGSAGKKLASFKQDISKKHIRGTFQAPLHLENNVIRDLSNWLAENKPELKAGRPQPGEDPIESYRKALAEQYATLSLIGFKRTFEMDNNYIPLTVHIDPETEDRCQKVQSERKLIGRSFKAEDLLNLSHKVAVVLGEPGMGKTTMLQYLVRRVSIKPDGLLPVFIKLANFCKSNEPLESFLLTATQNYVWGERMQESIRKEIKEEKILLLLDGLDEVNKEEYTSVTKRIRAFISRHKNTRVIITSRKAGFLRYEIPFPIFEIDRLPQEGINEFVVKWFEMKTDLGSRIASNRRINELAQNPFFLSIICLIFEKDQSLPKRRLELYRKCATTLLTLYDEKQIPKVNVFTRLLKEQVLENVAYHFYCKHVDEFPYEELIKQVSQSIAKLKQIGNEEKVVQEIRENSGLLQQCDDNHIFVHRTMYEYYVSRKMRNESLETIFARSEDARWEEPIRLYASQIVSKKQGTQFFEQLWKKDRALALRCYPEMMDQVVESELIKKLLFQASVEERVDFVIGLTKKLSEKDKIVETLREMFRWETNGEVIYWGVQMLEELKDFPGANEIVYQKLDEGAQQRFEKYIETEMVNVLSGTFKMGSPTDELDRHENEIQHNVKLDDFFISLYPITNRLYEEFDPHHRSKRDKYSSEDNQPVIHVNWYESAIFCRWLGCRLPSEAEWEYACRAGTKSPFNTGKNLHIKHANYHNSHRMSKNIFLQSTTTVGSYTKNAWGLYDMHGNVFEWCQDWYNEKYYDECKKQGIVTNPLGPNSGEYRVLRGGHWNSEGRYCRSAARNGMNPHYRDNYIGFRIVKQTKQRPLIFISNSWEDSSISERIKADLLVANTEVWLENTGIRKGDNLPTRINEALEWCNTVLIIWSKSAKKSRWIEHEWTNAFSLNRRIILCILDGTALPALFTDSQYIDFRNVARGIRELLQKLTLVEKPIIQQKIQEANEHEIEQLITNYPSQRFELLKRKATLIARRSANFNDLANLNNIIPQLPDGNDDFLTQTPKLRKMVSEIYKLQMRLETMSRPYFRELIAQMLCKEIENFQHQIAGFFEPLASEFRKASSRWLEIAQKQLEQARVVLDRGATPQVFRAGDPVDRDQEAFVTRDGILGEIEKQIMLSTGCPGIVLYGRRRVGKSTILRNLDHYLPSSVISIMISMQDPLAFTSVNNFSRLIEEKLCSVISRDLKVVSTDTDLPSLYRYLSKCNNLLKDERKRILLSIDEYENIDKKIGENVFSIDLLSTIRESIQTHRNITWIFAGSHEINELKNAQWTSYLVSVRTIEVPLFNLTESRLLLTEPMKHSKIWMKNSSKRLQFAPEFWGEKGIERIHQVSGGWPHLVQLMAETIIDLLNEENKKQVDQYLFDQAVKKAIISGQNVLHQLMHGESVRPGEWEYLYKFRTLEKQSPPNDEAVFRSLRRRQLIIGKKNEWRLRVPLMAMWLKQFE